LGVLKGPFSNGKILTQEYGETLELDDERITLRDAGHIIGSAQVLVEDEEGIRLAYTGDFRLPKAEVIPADVLVIEATYGNPGHSRPFRDTIDGKLATLVRASLEEGKPVDIYGYHGKLQEALSILRTKGIEEPAVMSKRIHTISKITERHGMNLGNYFSMEDDEAGEIVGNGSEHIFLHHMTSKRKFHGRGTRILLSGWQFSEPVVQRAPGEYVIALSSHSDFNGLIEYVEESQPQVVITDNYRVDNAGLLAMEITKRLDIPAYPMPF
ncbi:MAG: MBL fold metallo-hydrolase, partial [Candidatus Hydrothermarchaeota archaeon]|nr:MBL fold metallo-hydrolase [Candidatus Hydrothermarchaeota archaeon]